MAARHARSKTISWSIQQHDYQRTTTRQRHFGNPAPAYMMERRDVLPISVDVSQDIERDCGLNDPRDIPQSTCHFGYGCPENSRQQRVTRSQSVIDSTCSTEDDCSVQRGNIFSDTNSQDFGHRQRRDTLPVSVEESHGTERDYGNNDPRDISQSTMPCEQQCPEYFRQPRGTLPISVDVSHNTGDGGDDAGNIIESMGGYECQDPSPELL